MPTEKKLRVLMFSNIFGGKNTFIHNELVNLNDKFDIKYLALEEVVNESLKKEFNNFKIIPFKDNIFLKKVKWWLWKRDLYLSFKNVFFGQALKKEVDDFKPDVIHLHFGYEALKFLDNYYNPNIPYIIHFHGYGASQMFRKKSYVKKIKYYLGLDNVHHIHVSGFMKARFIKHNFDTTRSVIIRYGTDLSKFKQKTIENGKDHKNWVFTQVSSQVEKKGIYYAILGFNDFISKHKDLDCKFYITGSPTKENEALVTEMNLENKVIFTGLLSHIEVEKLLARTDVFIHCSVTSLGGDEEGIPNAIMEALAMRIPVLSTFHSGIPELVDNNVNGILVEERNYNQISDALAKMISMVPLKMDMHQYLKEHKYDLNSHLNEIGSLYYKVSKS